MSADRVRTHVVTGAGSGIGRAAAERLHARGDRLVLLARSEERAAALRAAYDGAVVELLDLADPAAVAAWTPPADVDRVDALLHVAGVVDLGPVAGLDVGSWQETLAVNLTAPALLTRTLLPALRAARGTVVLVNSGAGRTAHAGWSSYAASKFGLRGFADALREEEAPHGVRVSTVYPGRTATPMQEAVHAQEGAAYEAERFIDPATVAEAVLACVDLPRDATVPEVVLRPGPR
ncbi:SDR family oxidoreductase [Nocardioides sp. ChNu-153]|uniref:SDR family oxidoreductase n=1 Tax=unclassified Nocardioides TaxID=2615069 RepID=UPI002405ED46|nr:MULTISPECIES: SDR family oxidoreductase [unclassified Nocardioides]MDF9715443.1 SDR family oxidoreductase [Nocardioides sp. ChNu-99]MDN7120606.1 SDR family oxidoreductase [Nocardioides sp. ChNu-153]